MGTGPEVRGGYDILLTEIDEGFVIQAGSPDGAAPLTLRPARPSTTSRRSGPRWASRCR
jgi:hypothetical protein